MRKTVNVGTEKNCTKGLVTGLGRTPGEALRIVTLANGSSYSCGGRHTKYQKSLMDEFVAILSINEL